MSQIKIAALIISVSMALALAGCGDKNEKSTFDADSGHPSNWMTTHKTSATANVNNCTKCHGTSLDGGIAQVSCFSTTRTSYNGFACHATNPLTNVNCSSCHVSPPNGTTAPNRAGAHAKHVALAGVTCATCHDGGGSGTSNHAKSLTVSPFPVSYQAKASTAFGYNSADGTCSGIICHGGLKTPQWDSTVAIGCVQCHEQGTASAVPQYNSFFSGLWTITAGTPVNLHNLHNLVNIPSTTIRVVCTHCHSVTVLSTQHFNGLTTPAFDYAAAGTVGGSGTLINTYVPYTSTVPSGSCTSACHYITNDNPRYWVNP